MIRELLKNYVLAISMSIVMVLGNLQAPALAAETGGTNEDAAEYEIGYEEADKDAIDTAAAEDTLTAAGTDEETAEPLSATEEETAADETEAVGNEASEIETPESGGFSAGESLEAAPEAETALKAIEEEEETSDTAKAMNSFMSGDWTYETANGGVKITKYTGTESVVAIPEKLEGKTVTELGPEMMQGNRYVQVLTIPSGVKKIYYRAFNSCKNLSTINFNAANCKDVESWGIFGKAGEESGPVSVVFGPGVTRIPGKLFAGFDSTYARVTSISISSTVTEIGDAAFSTCLDLKSVEWGENIEKIGSSAFYRCKSLTTLDLPSKVTTVENAAFRLCTGVTGLTVPSKVTKIERDAFADCKKLSEINFNAEDCILETGAFDNSGIESDSLSVVFGAEVKKIPDNLFKPYDYRYVCITSVSIPAETTEIGDNAFYSCKDLKSIVIEKGITKIGSSAFGRCALLDSVRFEATDIEFGADVFDKCSSNLCLYCRYGSTVRSYAVKERLEYSFFGPPWATTKVTLTNVASGIKVSWNKVDGATGYYVYRDDQFLFKTSALVVTDKEVKYNSGTKYVYKVVATSKSEGDSPKYRTATTYRLMPVGIRSVTNPSAGKMKVTYDKSSGSSGYVVRYGLKSDMSDAKVITVSGQNTLSRTFGGMKKGNTYYVQVRTYKIDSGIRYYSGYCTTKTVKINR